MFWSVDRSISSGSRPIVAQCSARIAYLRANALRRPEHVGASAYCATMRRVFFSPPPPIMIGTLGRDSDCGELSSRSAWNSRPRNSPWLPSSPSHIPCAIWSVSSSISNRSPSGGNGNPSASRLVLVPGGADAEPGAAARQDVERGRRLDPQPRVAVVDAADHQPETRPFGLGGHEPERRPALEHRVLDRTDAPDLEEVVHDPERIEADLVGLAHDVAEGRADGRGPARPGERCDLEPDLHFVAKRTKIRSAGPRANPLP